MNYWVMHSSGYIYVLDVYPNEEIDYRREVMESDDDIIMAEFNNEDDAVDYIEKRIYIQ